MGYPRQPEDRWGRCPRCGGGMEYDGLVDLNDDDQGFQVLAAFRCRVCNHGLVELMDRNLATALESRLQPVE